mmetsp:Transcript_13246/g.22045  ORF Transcript_13246/g.22045 Transcript_13246/m.22045 type:complete len:84 (+) Transcript_13246:2134-2385(+)
MRKALDEMLAFEAQPSTIYGGQLMKVTGKYQLHPTKRLAILLQCPSNNFQSYKMQINVDIITNSSSKLSICIIDAWYHKFSRL